MNVMYIVHSNHHFGLGTGTIHITEENRQDKLLYTTLVQKYRVILKT